MSVFVDVSKTKQFLEDGEWDTRRQQAAELCHALYTMEDSQHVLGWRTPEHSVLQLEEIDAKAEEIRRDAEVFVIVGVGGSNQAARAVIEAMPERRGPKIVYLGNTLSPHYIRMALAELEGKSVYIDVIAKNFETLEPGSHFRILRQWMGRRYTREEMARRIIVTGTAGSRLEEIAEENGYLFLQFPASVGGRYSAFTPVGLFPLAAAGINAEVYLEGMAEAMEDCISHPEANPAVDYAAARSLLYGRGYDIEMMVSFEPRYAFFEKWWIQLFGESEGKEKKGIFPAASIYSEELHSIGQYMQDGRRNLIETFVSVIRPGAEAVIEPCPEFGDCFDYLDGMDFDEINKAAEAATWEAHTAGGVPCIRFTVEEISEKSFGQLFYYLMTACAISGQLIGVNPFDQEGVEEYKRNMFAALGKGCFTNKSRRP
ncbi:glucose-6-phosphate isomerase [Lacrimispora sp. 210928-DFI.3.58]|uniref:glucose-6-phosphate isomerase n=1 Tax=Lacrimispora sp. 210928-DFI.3.58 TaxID=2883214 RepID=UPI0015B64595|nr:glucose-6-phosphate isomerase [Lacrimispora sp. 210928-DFI.3.58]MCB7319093.1 glucose-6-phosphate isomerase [Lacrimispora sp. 210928-DFI.3.58]